MEGIFPWEEVLFMNAWNSLSLSTVWAYAIPYGGWSEMHDSWSSGPAYSFNPSRIVKGPSFLFMNGWSLILSTVWAYEIPYRWVKWDAWFMIQWRTVLPSRRLVGFREPFLHSIEISLFFIVKFQAFTVKSTLFFIGHCSPFLYNESPI